MTRKERIEMAQQYAADATEASSPGKHRTGPPMTSCEPEVQRVCHMAAPDV